MENWLQQMYRMSELRDEEMCPLCKCEEPEKKGFKDELSEKEFEISGICQECQDYVFTEEEEEEEDE